jgi:hypothetical protein
MKVLVDVRTLMANLETLNPGMDLTLVKVYLFDLAMGRETELVEAPTAPHVPWREPEAPATEPVQSSPVGGSSAGEAAADPEPEARDEPEVALTQKMPPQKTAAAPSNVMRPKRVAVTHLAGGSRGRGGGSNVRPSRDEKLARRAELEAMTSRPTREILASLTPEARRGENGQVLSEGVDGDGPSQPGDMELG